MSFDSKVSSAPATKADVANVAIRCAVALQSIAFILERMDLGPNVNKDDVETIRNTASSLDRVFDSLVGWDNDR